MQTGVLMLEQWASLQLGRIWNHRILGNWGADRDPMLDAGEWMLHCMAREATPEAKTALLAMGRIERGALGRVAREVAAGLAGPTPEWLDDIGTASIAGAFSAKGPGGEEALLLQADTVGAGAHMIAVLISGHHEGLAKHVYPIQKIDPLSPSTAFGSGMSFKAVKPQLACKRVRRAIERSDSAAGARLGESFSGYRALALARLTASDE